MLAWLQGLVVSLALWIGHLIFDNWPYIVGVILIFKFGARAIEAVAIAKFRTKEGIVNGWDWQKWARAEMKRRREWKRFRDMNQKRFAALVKKNQTRARYYQERAKILNYLADRAANGTLVMPFYIDILHHRANKNEAAASSIFRRIVHWEDLRRKIDAARDDIMRKEGREKLSGLMKLLNSSNEATASYALQQLNQLRNAVDWLVLIPVTVPEATRAQVVKLFALMAGTSNLSEARSALAQAERLMRSHQRAA